MCHCDNAKSRVAWFDPKTPEYNRVSRAQVHHIPVFYVYKIQALIPWLKYRWHGIDFSCLVWKWGGLVTTAQDVKAQGVKLISRVSLVLYNLYPLNNTIMLLLLLISYMGSIPPHPVNTPLYYCYYYYTLV